MSEEYVLSGARKAGFYCPPVKVRQQIFFIVAIPPVLLRALAEDGEMTSKLDLRYYLLPDRCGSSLSYDPESFEFAVFSAFKLRAQFSVHGNISVSTVIADFKWKDVVPELDGSYFGEANVESHMLWTVFPGASCLVSKFSDMPSRESDLRDVLNHCKSYTYREAMAKFNKDFEMGSVNPDDLQNVCSSLQYEQMAVSAAQSGTADAIICGRIQSGNAYAAFQPKRLTSTSVTVRVLKEEVEKSMLCVKPSSTNRLTVIIVCLKVPEFLYSKTDHVKYYGPGTTFTFKKGKVFQEWSIPDNVDVLILSDSVTARLLSAAVFDYFSTLEDTSRFSL